MPAAVRHLRYTAPEAAGLGDADGRLPLDALDEILASGDVKLLAVVHVSNVVGTINPIAEIARRAHAAGAIVVVDGAQAVPQVPVDLGALDADFYAWTGHKAYGPTGIGILHGRRELLDAMPPYQAGSNMAHDVELAPTGWPVAHVAGRALKFGAGTPNVSGAVGLAAAVRFLETVGRDAQWAHEQALTRHALARLAEVPGLRLLGAADASQRIPVFSFVLDRAAPLDIARRLDARGIAVRAGDLASLPLLRRLGVGAAAVRASFYLYNTSEEVDRLVDALREI
jgi:cysteine desulfurase/selenocysteine lyase